MFDKKDAFIPELVAAQVGEASPKLAALLAKIAECDADDMKKEGHLFKHMIFSGNPSPAYGAKIVASVLLAAGFELVFDASSDGTLRHKSEETLDALESEGDHTLTMLMSKPLYGKPMTTYFKKHTLELFNKRPENVHGDLVRFICIDGGFREGIDLFDIKYIHLLEPTLVKADERQAIGRGTRFCGQKGLKFHPEKGWPLHVFRYEIGIPGTMSPHLQGSKNFLDLQLKYTDVDLREVTFAAELEDVAANGAVDKILTKNVHNFKIGGSGGGTMSGGGDSAADTEQVYGSQDLYTTQATLSMNGLLPTDFARSAPSSAFDGYDASDNMSTYGCQNTLEGGNKTKSSSSSSYGLRGLYNLRGPKDRVPKHIMKHSSMQAFIGKYFMRFKYPTAKLENGCIGGGGVLDGLEGLDVDELRAIEGGAPQIIAKFTPTQDFVRHFFQPPSPYKGMLLYHSVGTGKTCTGIAAASSSFEKEGYTILWVTRHTLKADIAKNLLGIVCSIPMQERIRAGKKATAADISKSWMKPISYKQFSNMLLKQNQIYYDIVARNGSEDPLRKTLIIIDEAHKLYAPDAPAAEKPNMKIMEEMLQNSYKKSGAESARLLLMTGTPYTKSPMEMIKLLNLLRPSAQHIPAEFEEFARKYLNAVGEFTPSGRTKFLDNTAGYISYLNRSADARNFAHPIIHDVEVPMSLTQVRDKAMKFNKYVAKMKELRASLKESRGLDKGALKECLEKAKAEFEDGKTAAAVAKTAAMNAKKDGMATCNNAPKAERAACKERVNATYARDAADAKTQATNAKARFESGKADCKDDVNNTGLFAKFSEELAGTKAEYDDLRTKKAELRNEARNLASEAKALKAELIQITKEKRAAFAELKKIKDANERKLRRKVLTDRFASIKTTIHRIASLRQRVANIKVRMELISEKIGTRFPDDMSQQSSLRSRCKLNVPNPNPKPEKAKAQAKPETKYEAPKFDESHSPPRWGFATAPQLRRVSSDSPYEGPSPKEFRDKFVAGLWKDGAHGAQKEYRKLTLQYHPDKHPGQNKKYEKIFKVLSSTWSEFKIQQNIAGGA
jgi:superfamily II DNA or RNA helicase